MRGEIPTAPAIPQGYEFTYVETEAAITEAIQELHSTGYSELALVTIQLRYQTGGKYRPAQQPTDNLTRQSTHHLLQNLRLLVRKTDRVFLCGQRMYFVLLAANLQGAKIVEERLWEALLWRVHSMSEQDLPRPETASIGHSALPLPHASPAKLLTAALATSKHFGACAPKNAPRSSHSHQQETGKQPRGEEELQLQARKLGIPYLTFLPSRPPRRALQVVSARLARELRCYPVGRERNVLTVAMLNPQDHLALERLQQETGLLIFPVLTHPQALESALKHLG